MNEKETGTIEPLRNWSTMGQPAYGIRILGRLTTGALLTDAERTYAGMFYAASGVLFLNLSAPDIEGGIFVGSIKVGRVTERNEVVFADEIEVEPEPVSPLRLKLKGGEKWQDSKLVGRVPRLVGNGNLKKRGEVSKMVVAKTNHQ